MWELSCDYRDIIHEFTASDVPSLGHAIYGLNRPFFDQILWFEPLSVDYEVCANPQLGEGIETRWV